MRLEKSETQTEPRRPETSKFPSSRIEASEASVAVFEHAAHAPGFPNQCHLRFQRHMYNLFRIRRSTVDGLMI